MQELAYPGRHFRHALHWWDAYVVGNVRHAGRVVVSVEHYVILLFDCCVY
jgi:hypothetical protein